VKFSYQGNFDKLVDLLGHVPLPPYIDRPDETRDKTEYQTIFARKRGAVAAPTAGLHFTPRVLRRLRERGIETCEITLHVGLGTFQPIHTEQVEEHQMEAERFEISEEAAPIQRPRHKTGVWLAWAQPWRRRWNRRLGVTTEPSKRALEDDL
jgi:S-adenosylmethionine:tRNA ribosyltransferase-isomerase